MIGSKVKDKMSMMSNPIQFFTDYLANNSFVQRFITFRKIFPEGFIDHGLVTVPSFIRSHAKILYNIRININGYSGFSFLWNNLASFGVCKIMFLFHIVSFQLVSLFVPKSNGWYQHRLCV